MAAGIRRGGWAVEGDGGCDGGHVQRVWAFRREALRPCGRLGWSVTTTSQCRGGGGFLTTLVVLRGSLVNAAGCASLELLNCAADSPVVDVFEQQVVQYECGNGCGNAPARRPDSSSPPEDLARRSAGFTGPKHHDPHCRPCPDFGVPVCPRSGTRRRDACRLGDRV